MLCISSLTTIVEAPIMKAYRCSEWALYKKSAMSTKKPLKRLTQFSQEVAFLHNENRYLNPAICYCLAYKTWSCLHNNDTSPTAKSSKARNYRLVFFEWPSGADDLHHFTTCTVCFSKNNKTIVLLYTIGICDNQYFLIACWG